MQAGEGKILVITLPISLITLIFTPLAILMACTLSRKYPFLGYQICDALSTIGPLVPPKYVAPNCSETRSYMKVPSPYEL